MLRERTMDLLRCLDQRQQFIPSMVISRLWRPADRRRNKSHSYLTRDNSRNSPTIPNCQGRLISYFWALLLNLGGSLLLVHRLYAIISESCTIGLRHAICFHIIVCISLYSKLYYILSRFILLKKFSCFTSSSPMPNSEASSGPMWCGPQGLASPLAFLFSKNPAKNAVIQS